MQTIVTRYHGPRERRGSRYSARAEAGTVYLSSDDGLTSDGNHIAALQALCKRFGWSGKWAAGGLLGGRGAYVWVCLDERHTLTVEIKESDHA